MGERVKVDVGVSNTDAPGVLKPFLGERISMYVMEIRYVVVSAMAMVVAWC